MIVNRWNTTRMIAALLSALLMLAPPARAQETEPESAAATTPVPIEFESPAATLRTFVTAMGAQPRPKIDRGVAGMVTAGIVEEAANELAVKLYRCLNRIEYIDFQWDETLLDAEALAAMESPPRSWTFFPRDAAYRTARERRQYERVRQLAPEASIVLVRTSDGAWKFSAETVGGVEDLWSRIRDLDPIRGELADEYLTISERIELLWPPYFVEHEFLGVRYWQWISLFGLVLIGVVLDYTVRLLITLISLRIIARKGGEASAETLKRMVRPFGLTAAALLWLWTLHLLGLPVSALNVLVPAVRVFAMFAVVWAAWRVTDLVSEVFASKAERTATKIDDLLIPLVRKTVKVFITAVGLIYIADSLNIEILPLLTGLGIGTLAFGLAAKDSIENFFGSVAVIADRPFEVGDWVKIGDVEGTVEELGFRSTRVRTFYNSLVTVPNATLVRAVVDNFGRRKYRRWNTHLNITYGTPPERIDAFCEGIRELIRLHPYTRKDYYQVWLHKFGAHSLDVLVYVFHEAPDWQTELRERHRLMLDVIRLADRLGVEFAFPTQTLHVFREEPDAGHEPAQPPVRETDEQAQRLGRQAAHLITREADWRDGKPGPYTIRGSAATVAEDEESQIESKIGGDAG